MQRCPLVGMPRRSITKQKGKLDWESRIWEEGKGKLYLTSKGEGMILHSRAAADISQNDDACPSSLPHNFLTLQDYSNFIYELQISSWFIGIEIELKKEKMKKKKKSARQMLNLIMRRKSCLIYLPTSIWLLLANDHEAAITNHVR